MQNVTGPILTAIEQAWTIIQRRHPDVPNVAITLASGTHKRGLTLGHFQNDIWTTAGGPLICELFVGAEGLGEGAAELLDTLLHEAAHGVAHTRNIQDTSRQGRYHNGKFKSLAEELGLKVERRKSDAWAETTLSEDATASYRDTLARLNEALTSYRLGAPKDSEDEDTANPEDKPKTTVTLQCGCGRKIRASVKTAEEGRILCGNCTQRFAPIDT